MHLVFSLHDTVGRFPVYYLLKSVIKSSLRRSRNSGVRLHYYLQFTELHHVADERTTVLILLTS